MRIIIFIFLFLLADVSSGAQSNWELKKDEDGIKVYTANTANSNINSIKAEFDVKATQSELVAFLMDFSKQPEWVYGSKSAQLLKVVKPNELIYYSVATLPWPCTNRDYIAHFTVNQASPQLLTIDSHAEPWYIPAKPGLVRVQKSVAHWDVTTTAAGLHIVYTLQFDPGGNIPAWLVNMFITKGPLHTFSQLRERVAGPAYQNAHFDFIK